MFSLKRRNSKIEPLNGAGNSHVDIHKTELFANYRKSYEQIYMYTSTVVLHCIKFSCHSQTKKKKLYRYHLKIYLFPSKKAKLLAEVKKIMLTFYFKSKTDLMMLQFKGSYKLQYLHISGKTAI
ncbi:hypothetical protein OTU49_005581 [Cherax quadricarinatus]|uniref:Uncharacterized protein n=1 Tax=Cherax quadricarinatus TaxID=27406 RepID=A0AAW0YLJ1_CHEQU